MSEWKEYKFSSFVTINPTVKLHSGQRYSFVEMKDLEPSNKYCQPTAKRILAGGARFEQKDTLFARITPCLENGKICQVRKLDNNQGFGSTEFLVFRGKPGISNSEFVYYLSRWNSVRDFAEINLHGTSGRQRVPKEAFDELSLLLPPLPEQEAIAEVLSSLDDKIDHLHRNNKTLEQLAETLFRQWFVVEADDEWEVSTVGQNFETKGGGTPSTTDPSLWDGGICWTSPRDLSATNNIFLIKTQRTISPEGLKKINSGLLPKGTVLLSSRAPIGYLAIAGVPVAINQGYIACLPNEKYSSWYLHNWLKVNMEIIHSVANGSTFMEISKSTFRGLEFVKPPSDHLIRFNNMAHSLYQKLLLNENQIRQLEVLRDSLLPKLMSGAVKVNHLNQYEKDHR